MPTTTMSVVQIRGTPRYVSQTGIHVLAMTNRDRRD